jgi:uncharacterized membrane protein YgcG
MKTLMLRVCYLGLAVSTILASPGDEDKVTTDAIDPVADVLAPLRIADADALAEADLPAPLAAPAGAGDTNAPAKPPVPLRDPMPPPNVNLSPALAEVVKLIQAGVSHDVLLAYIYHSTNVFNIDSDAIVYLNDLGVTNIVITALIQHDSTPYAAGHKASAAAVQPLPPGVAATAPVTNVYPPTAAAARTYPAAGQTAYPGDFSSVTETNVESTNLPPAVVEAPLAPPAENVTVNHFYSSLAPYGSWMDVDGYGLCWRPTVAVVDPYWRPYSHRGRWMWTDCGWYWYSDYSWGWAPFHYGRWCSYPQLGWIWVPGTVWAPSWVTWRYTDGYCGWAPLPPGCGYRSGIGLTWYGRGVSIGFDFGLGWHCYNYVPITRFCDWNVSRHCLPENRLRVVHHTSVNINKVVVRNNNIVNNGIEPNTIARASRTKIPTMRIKDAALPVDQKVKPERLENNGNTVAVVRPKLPKTAPAETMPAVARGTATRAKPVNLASVSTSTTTKPNGKPLPANAANPPMSGFRDEAKPRRNDTVRIAPPNSGVQPQAQPRADRVERPQAGPQAPATRSQVGRGVPAEPHQQVARTAPVATPPRNNSAANFPAPAVRNSGPALRNVPPAQDRPITRPTPTPQAAPTPRQNANNGNIRSYAQPQPQRSIPHAAPQPTFRSQIPMATPQPAARPQFSAPRAEVSRPSVSHSAPAVRSAPAPSAAPRSAPSGGGGGGGGGGRSGGGGNGGGGGGKNRGN